MKALAIGLVVTLLLAACAASQPAAVTPDGKPTYHVECSATRRDLCYVKAAQLCPHGYDEVKGEKGSVPAAPPAPNGDAALPQVTANTLLISCK